LVILEQGGFVKSSLPEQLSIPVIAASNWLEAQRICREAPCCVLVDFDFDPTGVAKTLVARRDEWFRLSCVACSRDTSVHNIVRAMRAGCVDFVAKPIHPGSLMAACSYACRIDATGEHSPCRFRSRLATLTDRELEVLKLFVDGQNTKVIAKQLSVSYQTIDKHRNRALKKMRVNSLIDLARVLKGESLG
jgi:FixJ family two-component response regulator